MKNLLLSLAFLGLAGSGWAQPTSEGTVQYSWSYCIPRDNRLGPEVILQPKVKLPGDARLFLRLKNGPSKVTAVLFNSARGRMEARELPSIWTLEAGQAQASGWKRSNLTGSKTYLALLMADSAESEQVKALRRDWQRASDQGQDCQAYAQKLYDLVVLWHSENKGGSAVTGDVIQEVGAARAGAAARPMDTPPPENPPPNWESTARSVHWKSSQHPVMISRFASRP